MNKKTRTHIDWIYSKAEIEIIQARKWLKSDGANQITDAHLISIESAIKHLNEIKEILNNQ